MASRRTEIGELISEAGHTARLGIPLALGELGWMSTYLVDALFLGRLPDSARAIAASSLGNTIFYAIAFFVISLLNGLETLVAQAYGRRDVRECAALLVQSFWIVLVGTPLVAATSFGAVMVLPALGIADDVVAETALYVRALAWSAPPLLAYMALRRWLQSMNRVGLVTLSLLVAAPVNFVADWYLVLRPRGGAALGVVGSGHATTIVRCVMLLLVAVGTHRALRVHGVKVARSMLVPSRGRLAALLRIGWPTAVESTAELGVSTFASILGGRLGATVLAAHQVVLDLSAFTYQASAGLAYATVVRVGQAAGRGDAAQVRRASSTSLAMGLGFMAIASAIFALFARFWAGLYTNDAAVVATAAPILVLCSAMLLGDTIFVLCASSFAGTGDTRTPLVVSVAWNIGFGLPAAYLLAFRAGAGLAGMWAGRGAGSVAAGLTLLYLWRRRRA